MKIWAMGFENMKNVCHWSFSRFMMEIKLKI
jgi:hypothetical protein